MAPAVLTDEIADRIEAARLAVKECADRIIAQQQQPRGFGDRRNERIVLALVAVPERETHLSYFASTDGDDSKAVAVPKSVLNIIEREAGGLFLLAGMKGWVAADRHWAQANVPGLTKARKWSDEERIAWKRLQQRITQVRHNMNEQRRVAAGLRARTNRRTFAIRRSDTA